MEQSNQKSLEEINNTVPIPEKKSSSLRKLIAFSGPGALVAVGYMDPGNWITSIQGGALYGYLLLSVILLSSLIAMLLQTMCAKLGSALFFGKNPDDIGRFTQLYDALKDRDMVGIIASSTLATLFALALLFSGQNATITGTLTGQIVMEGFINLKLSIWKRRMFTRMLAITPRICSHRNFYELRWFDMIRMR
uniref:Amino acid transporter transmembrane domain-containing protein n=1 Tax=Glossina austeni TaxID=7395 RepID=A0A1A9UKM9_GLOAU